MRGRHALLLAALLAALPFQGCATGKREADSECGAALWFSGTTYQALTAWRMPVRGRSVGRRGNLDCDGSPVPSLGTDTVFAIGTLDPAKAVIVAARRSDVVFVARSIPEGEWPGVVQSAMREYRCVRPRTFRGNWNFIYTDTVPGPELYDIPVPYRAEFTARSGDAFDRHRWVSITIRARITRGTSPVPSIRTAKAAIRDHRPVTVSTTCTGRGNFEVTHLELTH